MRRKFQVRFCRQVAPAKGSLSLTPRKSTTTTATKAAARPHQYQRVQSPHQPTDPLVESTSNIGLYGQL
jgi:hypothetical protein